MPECGCSPTPLKGIPLLSKRSRKTNGFRSCPKSDGLIRRKMGPRLLHRVRIAIRRTALRPIDAERDIRLSVRFLAKQELGCSVANQQQVDGGVRLRRRTAGG